MTYIPYYASWVDEPVETTPIVAAALNNIEAGILAASVAVTDFSFNVVSYGAVGNGIADDTAAIQAAIDAASAAATLAGGETRAQVVIPGPNTYLLTYGTQRVGFDYWNALEIKSNVELVGVGRPRLFANQVGVHTPGLIAKNIIGRNANPGNNTTPVDNWAIRGLILDGGFTSDLQSPGIAFPDGTEDFFGINVDAANVCEITGCYVVGIYGDSIRLGDIVATDARLEGNYCTIFNGQALDLITGQRGIMNANVAYDNQSFSGGSSETVVMEPGFDGGVISSNLVIKCGTLGALGSNITVNGNYVAPWGGVVGGIELGPSENITVSGNVVDLSAYGPDLTSASKGIYASATTSPLITGNVVLMSNGALFNDAGGIACTTCVNPSVVGNTVLSAGASTGTGFDINVPSGAAVVAQNRCSALPQSISVGGIGASAIGNSCDGSMQIGEQANVATRILVKGNRCVAPTGALTQGLQLNNQGNIIADNVIDISGSTGRGIYQYGYNTGEGNVFVDNVIVGAAGVGIWAENFPGVGDIWSNNTVLGGGVPWLGDGSHFTRPSGGFNELAFAGGGVAVDTDAQAGEVCKLTVTDAVAFTISNPSNAGYVTLAAGFAGMQLIYDIKNSSGGAMGAITWGNQFLLAGAFTNPADTKRRTITFYWDGTNWVEVNRADADI